MREPRNPFRLRRSESIESDSAFLNLFEPGILEILDKETWNEKVRPLRSAAGGGKTSLLRLFTPSVLHTLHARRTEDSLKELYQKMVELGVLDHTGPRLLGVMLLCGRNYALLQDLSIDQAKKDRLFFSLLNVRIVLAILRAAMSLRKLDYPTDLHRMTVASLQDSEPPPGLSLPCDGTALFKWAAALESRICDALDSFGPIADASLPGHDTLVSLSLMRPEALTIDGEQIADRTLLMMDDIHKLTTSQREMLVQTVIELRSPVGVWIAERFEALSTEEMLASGANEGRDYERPIILEDYWREYYKRFEKHVLRIADKRVRAAAEREIDAFRPRLQDSLEGHPWEVKFQEAEAAISARIEAVANGSAKFSEWVRVTRQANGSSRERAQAWKVLEILINRELRKRQQSLFDDALSQDEFQERNDSSVRSAADLFLAREFGFPYYFGADTMSRLASLNIQQFLGLAGDAFEEVISGELVRRHHDLSPARQHALMKAAAQAMWDDIPNRVKHGRELRNLLEGIGRYSQAYTYQPNAPNDPGVGGTAIRMSERLLLLDEKVTRQRPHYARFASVLASALAHNLLIAQLDYSCKNERWMVLNLNRLLCVHFDLPLGYGLYKERPLDVLCGWLDKPQMASKAQESFL